MIKITLEFLNYTEAARVLTLIGESTKVTTVTTPTAPPAPTTPAPPAPQSPTLQELEQAMIDASERLNDSGAACWALLTPFGVQTIVELSDHQRQTLYEQVRRL